MDDKVIPATQVRNQWFEVLTWIATERRSITITKNNLPIAKLSPAPKVVLKGDVDDLIKRTYGMLKGKKGYFPYEDPKVIAWNKKKNLEKFKKWNTP